MASSNDYLEYILDQLSVLDDITYRAMMADADLELPYEGAKLVAAEYLDDEYKEKDVELLAWKTVKGTYPDTEHVKIKTLPSVKVASCMVKGGYEQMPDVYGAVIAWVNENGYEYDGSMFNIYHVSPHETNNPDEFVTEVCYTVK